MSYSYQSTKMNIWILCCLFAVAVADNFNDELNNLSDLNRENPFGNRPLFPFEAFGWGLENLFKKGFPPLLSAMNKHHLLPESKSESADVTETDYTTESKSSSSSDETKELNSRSSSREKLIHSASSNSESSEVKDGSVSSISKSTSEMEGSKHVSESDSSSSASSSGTDEIVQSASSISEFSREKLKSMSSNSEDSSKSKSKSETGKKKSEFESASMSYAKSKISVSEASSKGISSSYSSSEEHREISQSYKSWENSDTETRSSKSQLSEEPEQEKRSESESNNKKSSGEKSVEQTVSESSDIGSGALLIILSKSQERDSEIEYFEETSENKEEIKEGATSVSSGERDVVSTSKAQNSNHSSSESKSVAQSDSASREDHHSAESMSDSKSGSTIVPSEDDESLDYVLVDSEACVIDEDESLSSHAIESESQKFQASDANKEFDIAYHLTIPEVRKQLEDSYNKLAEMKKRLRRKEIQIDELNQVIGELQLLCDRICSEVPVNYLVTHF